MKQGIIRPSDLIGIKRIPEPNILKYNKEKGLQIGAAVPIRRIFVFIVETDGKEIPTIEGLSKAGTLHALQQAFVDEGAVQCGFCTPGMILTAKAFLDSHPLPSEARIREAMAGNLCRCTGYNKIVRANMSAYK